MANKLVEVFNEVISIVNFEKNSDNFQIPFLKSCGAYNLQMVLFFCLKFKINIFSICLDDMYLGYEPIFKDV